MIYFLAAGRHAATLQRFLLGWGKHLAIRVSILPYESVISREAARLQKGTYIFMSFGGVMGGRNPPSPLRQAAGRLHRRLVDLFGPERVLNDPLSSLRRFDILQALYDR